MLISKKLKANLSALRNDTPGERFQNHKAGVKANWFVRRHGKGLLPELFAHLNPMPYEAAQQMEQDLADELQEKGWGVWQA